MMLESLTIQKEKALPKDFQEKALYLELQMTESAFAHEYALLHLNEMKEALPFLKKEALLFELEKHKQSYFVAREEMLKIDPEKLDRIETLLRVQKEELFQTHPSLH